MFMNQNWGLGPNKNFPFNYFQIIPFEFGCSYFLQFAHIVNDKKTGKPET